MQPKRAFRWKLVVAALLVLVVGGLTLWFGLFSSVPVPARVAWTLQPDQFPIGTAIQGSRVEFSLACITSVRAKPLPPFLNSLPSALRGVLSDGFTKAQAMAAKSRWRIHVDAPPFVILDASRVEFHPSHGVMVTVHAHLDTSRTGAWRGNIQASLRNRSGNTDALAVPVHVKVVPRPATGLRRILITETPFDLYSTDKGNRFDPLAQITARLAERGVQVDFREQLPDDLSPYDLVLLAGTTLASLPPSGHQQVKAHVARGGCLVLAANAFFVGTSQNANAILQPLGLKMDSRDAGMAMTNGVVLADPLTARTRRLSFHRPVHISVTDPAQGKVLVQDADGPNGFVAVSRKPGRGEVRVLAQSLWWNWLYSDTPDRHDDNALLMEDLLRPDLR